jgi:hypothetical protein
MIKRSNLMNCTFPELGIAQHFASPMMIDYCCLQLFRLFNSSDLTKKVSLRNEATASGTVSDFWGSSSAYVSNSPAANPFPIKTLFSHIVSTSKMVLVIILAYLLLVVVSLLVSCPPCSYAALLSLTRRGFRREVKELAQC